MDLINILVPLIIALLGGGGVSILMNMKADRARAKAIAEHEQENSIGQSISNAKEIISLNRQTSEDKEKLWDKEREMLIKDIDILKAKVIEQDKIIQKQEEKITDQALLIAKYLKAQVELDRELKLLKEQLLN